MSAITAAKHAADNAAQTVLRKRTRIVELDESFSPLFDELSEVSLARAEAERRERELKAEILSAAGMNEDRGETLVVKAGGKIRAKVGMRLRTGVSTKDLQAAFPEAYEATKSETEYQVVSPA
jgi:hypothetical protein